MLKHTFGAIALTVLLSACAGPPQQVATPEPAEPPNFDTPEFRAEKREQFDSLNPTARALLEAHDFDTYYQESLDSKKKKWLARKNCEYGTKCYELRHVEMLIGPVYY